MQEELAGALSWLHTHPPLQALAASGLLVFVAWLANWIVKRILVRGLYRLLNTTTLGRQVHIEKHGVIRRLANVVPALILANGVDLVPGLPKAVVSVVGNVGSAFIVLSLALAIGAAMRTANELYLLRPGARLKPIKGYLQVIMIGVYSIAAILVIAALIDRSPLILLSGLGAMAAVLMLIFQDTILSLVASIQIVSNDIVRVGDWVEMPNLNADGEVFDVALHTVKIRNWDMTITSIPTKRFISDPFKNWRGMQESGGRRIQRCLYLDLQSVHFLDAEERQRLHRFSLLDEYLQEKRRDIEAWNAKIIERGQDPVNTRRITNLGSFRAYVERYLRSRPDIHKDMTLLVRLLSPSVDGQPLEIYCFTTTVAWAQYEAIQADVFEHLLAILPEFGLRVYQRPSGADLHQWPADRPTRSSVQALLEES